MQTKNKMNENLKYGLQTISRLAVGSFAMYMAIDGIVDKSVAYKNSAVEVPAVYNEFLVAQQNIRNFAAGNLNERDYPTYYVDNLFADFQNNTGIVYDMSKSFETINRITSDPKNLEIIHEYKKADAEVRRKVDESAPFSDGWLTGCLVFGLIGLGLGGYQAYKWQNHAEDVKRQRHNLSSK